MKNKVLILLFVFIVLIFSFMNTTKIKSYFTELDAKKGIDTIKSIYGAEMAKIIEKMYRLETAHFKSSQYLNTGSAGMEVGKWKIDSSNIAGTYTAIDNHLKEPRNFIVWNSVTDSMVYLADYIKRYNGNFARWNTTDIAAQDVYRKKVDSIKSRWV